MCRHRIAREEQALLAVSVVLATIRWLACEPCLQKGLPGSTSATKAVKKKPRRDPRGLQSFRLIPITRPDQTKLAALVSFVPHHLCPVELLNCVLKF